MLQQAQIRKPVCEAIDCKYVQYCVRRTSEVANKDSAMCESIHSL